jgi:hypothetical protein
MIRTMLHRYSYDKNDGEERVWLDCFPVEDMLKYEKVFIETNMSERILKKKNGKSNGKSTPSKSNISLSIKRYGFEIHVQFTVQMTQMVSTIRCSSVF